MLQMTIRLKYLYEDVCISDLKRSCSKTDSTGKKIRLKKRHDNRNDEGADESMAGVSSIDDTAADEDAASRDEEIANSRDNTDTVHLLRLENDDLSSDRTMSVKFGRLKNADSAEKRTNALDLGKLGSADSAEELVFASDEFSHSSHLSNNESSSTKSCSSSPHVNYALVQSSCPAATCSSSSCTASHRCSLQQNSIMSTPSSSSLLIHHSQSSLQSSHLMTSFSPSFKMTTGHSMTTSENNDILSIYTTPFVPDSLLPRP